MWVFKRLLQFPWTEHENNTGVLNRKRKCSVKRRKIAYPELMFRNTKYYVLELIIWGKIEGGIRCRKYSRLRNIRGWTGLGVHAVFRVTRTRIICPDYRQPSIHKEGTLRRGMLLAHFQYGILCGQAGPISQQ